MTAKRIGIFGAGGVGGTLAARLALSGADVGLLARGQHLNAILEKGLMFRDQKGMRSVPIQAVESPEALGPCDLVIVATKMWDLEQIAPHLPKALSDEGYVMCLQNGVDAPSMLAKFLPEQRILAGVAELSATISAPGEVSLTSPFCTIRYGRLGPEGQPELNWILFGFQNAGIDAFPSSDIQEELWRKFIFLTTFSGATATTGKSIGEITSTRAGLTLVRNLLCEAISVSKAEGIKLPVDTLESQLAFITGLPGHLKASMAHDREQGKRLELEWLAMRVVELGLKHDVPTPAHTSVAGQLMPFRLGRPGE